MVDNGFAWMTRGKGGVCVRRTDAKQMLAAVPVRLHASMLLLCALAACAKADGDAKDAATTAAPSATATTADAAPGAGGPPPMMAPRSLDISPYVAEVDADGDGCMSHEEWVVKAGAPVSSYDMLKDEKGCVTFERMFNESAPGGIDANGDGKLTLAEMLEFDKKMAPLMQGKEPPPR